MMRRATCAVVLGCGLLAACGTNGDSQPGPIAKRAAALDTVVQVSPDFPLDQDAPLPLNPNVSVQAIAGSAGAGYLLALNVPYAADIWSRPNSQYYVSGLTLMHLDALGGSPTVLATVPSPEGAFFNGVRLVDVGSGWLLAYEIAPNSGGGNRYVVTVARDGTLGTPLAVLGPCAAGQPLVGFARSADSALLSDACGNGVLLDLSGHVLKTMFIATSDTFSSTFSSCTASSITGGQLAFNGIDFLALYYCQGTFPKSVVGVPVSPSGVVATPIAVVSQPQVPYAGVSSLSIAGNNGAFLAVVAEIQSSGPQTAAGYKTITETSGHVFSVGVEHILPGESVLNDGKLSDRGATAVARGGGFAIVREHSNGDFDLVTPNSTGADTVLSLQSSLATNKALVSSIDPYAIDDRLIIVANARGVRFDAAAAATDAPPLDLISAPRGQYMPALAFDGSSYLAVWSEGVRTLSGWPYGKTPQIFGHRLSTSGALLGSSSFQIDSLTDIGTGPLVAANPGSVSVAWNTFPGSALTGAATVSSADPPVITSYAAPAGSVADFGIATDGSRTTVAWAAHPTSVLIAQLASGGTWSTPLTVATANVDNATVPVLAFDGTRYAALWTGPTDTEQRAVYGSRVSASMALLDATPKELQRFALSTPTGPYPGDSGVQIVAAGDHLVMAWSAFASGNEELRVARLSSSLEVLDSGGVLVATPPASIISSTLRHVALDWDGSNVWVVWRDVEGGSHRPTAVLRGRRFSAALAPVDAAPFLIATDLDEYSRITLAHSPDSSMVGYTRYSANTFRVRGRLLSTTSTSGGGGAGGGGATGNAGGTAGGGADNGGSGALGGVGNTGGSSVGGATQAGDAGEAGNGPVAEAGSDVGGGAGVTSSGGASGAAHAGASSGGHAGASSGHAGASSGGHAGATAGSGGGGSHGGSCSVRLAGGPASRAPLVELAGLFALIVCVRRRKWARPGSAQARF